MSAAKEYDEEGRRVRAAVGYSRLKRTDFAKEIGYADPRTLDRTTAGERSPGLPELRRIAKTSGVPLLFLTHGWDLYRAIEDLTERPSDVTTEQFRERLRRVVDADDRMKRNARSPDDQDRQEGAA